MPRFYFSPSSSMLDEIHRILDRPEWYSTTKPPAFGHPMLEYFSFDPNYTNLNHGSYGSLPKPVAAACRELWDLAESAPDLFHRVQYQPLLVAVRQKVAELIGVKDVDEVVMVPNASHGLNTILRNLWWQEGDVIVTCNTTYNSISRTAQYLHDIPPHPSLSQFVLLFPIANPEDILSRWRAHLEELKANLGEGKKVVAVIDALISNPGILLPWKKMVEICRELGVWSVIDAAHSIGQEVGTKLDEIKPDFWISNCHKWLLSKRSGAVMYVPKRNQHLVISSFPTAFSYISPKDQRDPTESFVVQYEWNGTVDFVPYLSVSAALDFRNWIGGELAINEYCHKLAMDGGKRLAEVMQTELMDKTEEGAFTANMVNVALPFPPQMPGTSQVGQSLQRKLLLQHKVYGAPYYHNEKWWVRASAQIWNEISDFEKLGEALKVACSEVVEELRSQQTGRPANE